MYEGNPAILTASDIEEVRANGVAETLSDGRIALPVLLVLDAASGKNYVSGETFPAQLHLTNGIWHKLLDLLPHHAAPAEAPADTPVKKPAPSKSAKSAPADAPDEAPAEAAPAE